MKNLWLASRMNYAIFLSLVFSSVSFAQSDITVIERPAYPGTRLAIGNPNVYDDLSEDEYQEYLPYFDGICHAFGFKSAVPHSEKENDQNHQSVLIGESGEAILMSFVVRPLKEISCRDPMPAAYTMLEKVTAPLEPTTHLPYCFDDVDSTGETLVCKQMGFSRALAGSPFFFNVLVGSCAAPQTDGTVRVIPGRKPGTSGDSGFQIQAAYCIR
jgi:hypothetical protein